VMLAGRWAVCLAVVGCGFIVEMEAVVGVKETGFQPRL